VYGECATAAAGDPPTFFCIAGAPPGLPPLAVAIDIG